MPLLKQEELKKQIDKLKDKDGEEFCKNLRKKKLQVEASYKTSEKAPPTPLTESERNNLDIDFNNTLLEIPLLQKEIELSRGDKRLKKGAIIIDNIGKLLDLAKILEKELDNSDELMQLRKSLVEAKEVAASSGENLNVANKSALIKEKEIEILNSKKEIYLTIKVASDSLSIFKESDKSKVKKNNHNSSNINTATNSSANFYPEFNSNIKKLNLKIESFEEELKNKIADVKPTNDTRSGTGIVHNNLEKHILESKKYYNRATHSSLQEELIKALSNNKILIQESQAIGSALTEGEEIFDTVAIDLETNLQRINDLKAYKEALRQVIDILGLPKNTDTHALLDHLKKSFSPAQNLKIALGLADIDLVDEAAIRKQVDAVFESRDPNKDVINLIKSLGLTANDTKEDVIKAAKKILIEPSLKDKIKEAQDAVRKMFVIDDNASSDEIAAAVKTVRESSRSDDSLRKEYQKFKTSLGLDSTALVSVVIPKVQEILGKLPPSLDPVKTRIRAILGINGRTVDHNAVAVAVTRIVTAEGVVVGREVDYDNLISALGTEDVANFDQIVESVKRTLNKMDPLSLAQVKNELSELLGNPTNAQETAEAIERIRTPDDDESNNANKDRAKLAALLGVDLTNQEAAKNAARRTLDQVISLDAVKNELNALLNNPISPQEVEERIVAIRDAVDNGDGVADEARARLAALLGVVDGANHEAQVNASKRILNQMDVASLDAVKNEIRAILGNPTNDEALTQALTNVRNLVDDGTNHANETRARLAALLGVDNLTDIEAAKNAARRSLDQVISLDAVKNELNALLNNPISPQEVEERIVAIRDLEDDGDNHANAVRDRLAALLGVVDGETHEAQVNASKRILNQMDVASLDAVKNEIRAILGNPTNDEALTQALTNVRNLVDDGTNHANETRARLAALLGVDNLTDIEAAKNAARRTLDQVISLDAVKNELNALLNNPISPQEVEERIVAIRDAVDNGDGVADEARARLAALLGVVDGANHEAQVNASKRILNQMDVASLDAVKNEIRAILGNPNDDEALTQALTTLRDLADDGHNHADETRARLAALLGVDNLTDIEAAKNAARRSLDQVISLDAVKNELNALLNNPISPQEVEERIVAIRDAVDNGDGVADEARARLAALLGVVDGANHEAQVNASKRILNQMDVASLDAVKNEIRAILGNPTNDEALTQALTNVRNLVDDGTNHANETRARLAALLGVDNLTDIEAAKNAARRTLDQVISLDAVKNELNALLNNPISPQEVEERIVAIRDAVDNGDGVADEARARLAALLGVVDGANHEAQVNASKRILNQMDVASLDAVKNEIRAILGNPTNDEALTQALTNVRNLVDDGTNHANETRARLAALLGVDNLTDIEAAKNAARRSLDQVISLDAVKNELNALLNNPISPQEVEERIVAIRDLEDDGDNHANAVRDRLAALLGVVDGETHEAQVNASKRILNQMDVASLDAVKNEIRAILGNPTNDEALTQALTNVRNLVDDGTNHANETRARLAALLGVDNLTDIEAAKNAARRTLDQVISLDAVKNELNALLNNPISPQEVEERIVAIRDAVDNGDGVADEARARLAALLGVVDGETHEAQVNASKRILNQMDAAAIEAVQTQIKTSLEFADADKINETTIKAKIAALRAANNARGDNAGINNLADLLGVNVADDRFTGSEVEKSAAIDAALTKSAKDNLGVTIGGLEQDLAAKAEQQELQRKAIKEDPFGFKTSANAFFRPSGNDVIYYRQQNSNSNILNDEAVAEKVKQQRVDRVTNGVKAAVDILNNGGSINDIEGENLRFFLSTFAHDSYWSNRSSDLTQTKKEAVDQYMKLRVPFEGNIRGKTSSNGISISNLEATVELFFPKSGSSRQNYRNENSESSTLTDSEVDEKVKKQMLVRVTNGVRTAVETLKKGDSIDGLKNESLKFFLCTFAYDSYLENRSNGNLQKTKKVAIDQYNSCDEAALDNLLIPSTITPLRNPSTHLSSGINITPKPPTADDRSFKRSTSINRSSTGFERK